jgi:hypothetical protein
MKIINYLNKKYYLIFAFFYITIIYSLYSEESSLSGARHDYLYHLKFILLFKENSIHEGLRLFGGDGYAVRNSPFFYIIYGFLNKYFSLNTLQILNSVVSVFIAFSFFQCLKFKYKNNSNISLSFISCIIFLSPTVRSLSVWPYPLIWGLFFFIISIYFYLKFLNSNSINNKYKFSLITTAFLCLASYIHPTLSLFNFYYLFNFNKCFKFSRFLHIIILNIFFSIPLLYFITNHDLLFFYKAEGAEVDISTSLNIFNKIIIISSIILFYSIPLLNIKELIKKIIIKIEIKFLILALIFTILASLNFNYPYTELFGGGFFHKFSYLFFGNYLFLFCIFFITLILYYSIFDKKINNYLLYFTIILTNIQYTIYNKYYDVLVLVLFFLLFEIDLKKYFFNKKFSILFMYLFYFSYYLITVYKNDILFSIKN